MIKVRFISWDLKYENLEVQKRRWKKTHCKHPHNWILWIILFEISDTVKISYISWWRTVVFNYESLKCFRNTKILKQLKEIQRELTYANMPKLQEIKNNMW